MKPRGKFSIRIARWHACAHRSALVWLAFIGTGLAALSVAVLRRGMIHPEAYSFLPHYLGDRSLAAKVFDVGKTDWSLYNGRELSYFFDFLDCRFIAWSIDHGWPHFLSACHYVFLGLTCAAMVWFARQRLRLPRLAAALLALLFLTTPAVFLGGSYFRSAKQGVTLCLLLSACTVAPAFASRDRSRRFPWPAWAGTIGAASMMGFFDRQGFFLILLLGFALLIRAVVARDRDGLIWLCAAAAPAALVAWYNRQLGPALIEHFNGHRPSFAFQELPWNELTNRETLFNVLFYAPQLMLDNLRFLLGDIPLLLAGLVLVAGVIALGPRWPWPASTSEPPPPKWRRLAGVAAAASLPLALAGMDGVMILRMKAVIGLDLRRLYYGLPSMGVFWILASLAVAALWRHCRVRAQAIWLALFVLVASNAVALVEHRAIIRLGLYRDFYRTSPALISALSNMDQLPLQPPGAPLTPLGWLPEGSSPARDPLIHFFQERRLKRMAQPPR